MMKLVEKMLQSVACISITACGVMPSQSALLDDINPGFFHECQLTKNGLEEISKNISTQVLVAQDYLLWGKEIKDMGMKEGDLFIAPYAFQTKCFIDQPSEVTMDFIIVRSAVHETSGEVSQYFKKAKYFIVSGEITLVDATIDRAESKIVSEEKGLNPSVENSILIYSKDKRVLSLGATYDRIYGKDFQGHAPMALPMKASSADENIFLVFRSGLISEMPLEGDGEAHLIVSWDMKLVTFNKIDGSAYVNNAQIEEVAPKNSVENKPSEAPKPDSAGQNAQPIQDKANPPKES